LPNNSKQPTCTPAKTVTAPPPSIIDAHCGAKCKLKSTCDQGRSIALLTRAQYTTEFLACEVHKRLARRIKEGALGLGGLRRAARMTELPAFTSRTPDAADETASPRTRLRRINYPHSGGFSPGQPQMMIGERIGPPGSHAPGRGSQVRRRLAAGGRGIRTSGPSIKDDQPRGCVVRNGTS